VLGTGCWIKTLINEAPCCLQQGASFSLQELDSFVKFWSDKTVNQATLIEQHRFFSASPATVRKTHSQALLPKYFKLI
jgi:hypothetical protein